MRSINIESGAKIIYSLKLYNMQKLQNNENLLLYQKICILDLK